MYVMHPVSTENPLGDSNTIILHKELPHSKLKALKQQETKRVYFIKKGCDQL